MLKGKHLYVCLATGLLLAIPLGASAKIVLNKISLNGVSLNGTTIGTRLNASKIVPITSQGVVGVEGGQLVMRIPSVTQ